MAWLNGDRLKFGARATAMALGVLGPLLVNAPARSAGDLLVAPTRVVLEGQRSAEVILKNVGQEAATYRVSLELRRMTESGNLTDVEPANANAAEQAALAMITYAPRRIELPPNQPQAIRIGVRPAAGLADGEYRVHMLFRAIPPATPAVPTPASGAKGVSIALTPIFGVTIPVIVRQGRLSAQATIDGAELVRKNGETSLALQMSRNGNRSVYGNIIVRKASGGTPLFEASGVAIYPEVAKRQLLLPLPPESVATLSGPVTIDFIDPGERGGLIASYKTSLK